jgi:putative transposase
VKHKRFTVEQIVADLKQAEAGVPMAELIRRVGISEQTFYRWKKQYVGLEVDQVRQLKQLQEENTRLKQVVADLTSDKAMFRLCWESIAWVNGRHGTLLVTHGKTAAARRVLPMTPRVRRILEARWEIAGKPTEGWVWLALTGSGHVESCSLKKQYAKTFRMVADQAAKNNLKPVRPFVLYSLRHTFLTRLGESGCDVWTLARIAGHSSINMSSRYVHPSQDAVLNAMARLGGHKNGPNQKLARLTVVRQ